jgi:hypothetical protein
VFQVRGVDLTHTAVDDRLLHWVQAVMASDRSLAERADVVTLCGYRVITAGTIAVTCVVKIHVKRVDMGRTARRDTDNLAV